MSVFKMELSDNVLFIIDKMKQNGYSAHVVGGSVRDSLIGRELGDIDLTTDALPEQTKATFEGYKTVDTGIKHGTVTLVLDGTPYEITTYRIDGDYKDNRHPDSVTFTASLEEDLARRDFTVNAMAYSPAGGLVDPFGGQRDAEDKILRAVGDPYIRFDEDALRILRALRFASVLGFEVENNTARAARALAKRLKSVSSERIYSELKKLIAGDNAYEVIKEYADILSVTLEGVRVEKLPDKENFNKADYLTRLASIIYLNSENPSEESERILTSLKTDKFTRIYMSSAFMAYKEASFANECEALSLLANHGKEATEAALKIGLALGKFTQNEKTVLSSALASGKPYAVSHLAIRGGDLSALGIKGEKIGEILNSLIFAVIGQKVDNNKNALIDYIKEQYEL